MSDICITYRIFLKDKSIMETSKTRSKVDKVLDKIDCEYFSTVKEE